MPPSGNGRPLFPRLAKVALTILALVLVAAWIISLVAAHFQMAWADVRAWGARTLQPPGGVWRDFIGPSILCATLAIGFRLLYPRPGLWARGMAALLLFWLIWRYLFWRVFATLNLSSFWIGFFSVLLLLVEIIRLQETGMSMLQTFLWPFKDKRRSVQADLFSKDVLEGRYRPTVDVLVPTYNESVGLLRRTLMGCQAMDYVSKKICLLDDKNRPEMRALSEELGCSYFTRTDNKHAKAGNLNSALRHLDGELVVVFDSDFVPTRNFLARTVGLLQDPTVAMVQTPKHFYNEESFRFNLGIEKQLTCEEDVFYRYILPTRDTTNSFICHGTSYVLRRSALDKTGGYPTISIVEDFPLSIQLQSAGYTLIYLDEVLSTGAAPETVGAFVDQRLRWANGCLRVLYTSHNPMIRKGLSFVQRLHAMSCILHWIDVPSRLLFLLYPPLSLFFSFYFMLTPVGSVLYFWLPYFLGYLLLTEWINGGTRSSFWSEVYETVVAFPLALVASRSLVDPRGGKFKVSPKGESTEGIQVNWTLALPLMGIMALSIAALVKTLWSGVMQTFDPEFAAINITWTCYNLGMLSVSIQACIDVPQERKYLRFDHRVPFGLRLDSRAVTGVTENLSEQGGLLHFSEPIPAEEISPAAHLSLPELGIFDVPIKLHRKDKDSLVSKAGVEYASLTLAQQRRIVEFLFSRPEHWQKGSSIPQIKTLSGYLRSIIRLYPLAETRDVKSPGPDKEAEARARS